MQVTFIDIRLAYALNRNALRAARRGDFWLAAGRQYVAIALARGTAPCL